MASSLSNYPSKPNDISLQNAYLVLINTHDTSSSFLEIFKNTRVNRKARGTPTDEEQDLLRAMLVFSTSGLDSMIKHMINDALPKLILKRIPGVVEMFKSFIESNIEKGGTINSKFIANVLGDSSPHLVLVNSLIYELTSSSLQSLDQILKVAAYFDIKSDLIVHDKNKLKYIFRMRNQISHEMDIDFTQTNRNRTPRGRDDMILVTNEVFEVANLFLGEVDSKL